MLDRLKRALVETYVGAIALGYLFAQAIQHFVNIFASPVAGWISRKQYGGLVERATVLPGFSLQDALPELVRFSLLLLVWYFLLRWLYVKPFAKEISEAAPNPEQAEGSPNGGSRRPILPPWRIGNAGETGRCTRETPGLLWWGTRL